MKICRTSILILAGFVLMTVKAMAANEITKHFHYAPLVIDPMVKTLKPNQEPPVLARNIMSINVGNRSGGVSVKGGDFVVPASVCEKSDSLICFHSEAFNFAIPRNFPNGPRSWDSGRFHYYIFGSPYNIRVLGEKIRVWVIKMDDRNDPEYEHQYIYSLKRGLIAFSSRRKGSATLGSLLILLDRCGFASQHCKLQGSQIQVMASSDSDPK